MQTRHRVPTIFTLYMVDVFCCALGCVILLWLANARDARRKGTAHAQAARQLSETRLRLASTEGELTNVRAANLAAQKQYEDVRRDLKQAESVAVRLRTELKEARTQEDALTAALAKKTQEYQALAGMASASEQLLAALRKELQEKTAQLAEVNVRATGLTTRLREAEARVSRLEREADTLRGTARNSAEQLAALESRSRVLEKDLDRRNTDLADAGKRLRELLAAAEKFEQRLDARGKELAAAEQHSARLEGQVKSLTGQVQEVRTQADRRFAGITLTGERVVFLVDMSGSMRMRDPATEDRTKWPLVCETLGRLMHSLPSLKRYQVIVFSDRLSYPLGGDGRWLEFDRGSSVKVTVDQLKRVTPSGETNMYAAFAEAFRFRSQGLDTIYLFSDGLPNVGEGIPAGAIGLKETEKAIYLSRHVRQTLKSYWNQELVGRPRVRINAIGFYFDSPDVGAFLWALAREHDGSFVGMSRP
ncbi:MAG TPA: VWA domain-containing protein [Gemmataceae bacterium]|nr:VWA domain-containing protein [Gemmataceae bacterium]